MLRVLLGNERYGSLPAVYESGRIGRGGASKKPTTQVSGDMDDNRGKNIASEKMDRRLESG